MEERIYLKGTKVQIDNERSVGVCLCSDNSIQIEFINHIEGRYWKPMSTKRDENNKVTTYTHLSKEAAKSLFYLIGVKYKLIKPINK